MKTSALADQEALHEDARRIAKAMDAMTLRMERYAELDSEAAELYDLYEDLLKGWEGLVRRMEERRKGVPKAGAQAAEEGGEG